MQIPPTSIPLLSFLIHQCPTRGGTARFCHTGDVWQAWKQFWLFWLRWGDCWQLVCRVRNAGEHSAVRRMAPPQNHRTLHKAARRGPQRLRLMPRLWHLRPFPVSSPLTSSAVCFSPLEHQPAAPGTTQSSLHPTPVGPLHVL